MKAVHFGAGNIGRGFIGLLLHDAGYDVVFSDVNPELIAALQAASSYTVHEVGEGGVDRTVTGFNAVNSAEDEERLVAELSTADIITTAVGPNVLRFIAPAIARGLAARSADRAPVAVMACENAIGATDTLRTHIEENAGAEWNRLAERAIFANTAVDRIVPAQSADAGIDVTVEAFHEWVVERGPFGGAEPTLPGAHFVDDLAPYIERKLYTVNTGHATIAYFGFLAGHEKIADAAADPTVSGKVRSALEETSAYLVAVHGLDADEQSAYRETILSRFANEHLPDTVQRVGREPLRKLGRHERFIGPAAAIAERGNTPDALVDAIGAALQFHVADDAQSQEMAELLETLEPSEFVAQVMGLDPQHPLFDRVCREVAAVTRTPR
ncbi:mannitol-1-phosphate 5-dehydrogenase [Paramicrobacterium agarici]|uniref:Mannitol-1-phosphate 5-dehydrogenase n=1 Tax=Paramicrobacterium agarici TaxID=630514 RepID=A0A2A9E1Q1_9MICO|nr:mannitol-1-phosphate 5-dehydrogenase [Microbacterium agarici]PFG32119.1 D-mannitol 1-phosphate 5-dehydrogenase [Microbacterium agarici]